jgi:hypothetical protein
METTMTHTSLADTPQRGALPWLILGGVLLAWGVTIFTLAEAGAFRQGPGLPPFRLMAAIVIPVLTGVLIWNLWPALRAWTESWDLAAIVAIQTFRVAGIVFIFFWWIGALPTVFAWVAGLGDIAVGILAIPTTLAVARQTPGWQTWVKRLTFFGILDFAVVLATGTLSQEGNLLNFPGEPVPAAMQVMPMIMIPGYFVPMFILLLLLQRQRATA